MNVTYKIKFCDKIMIEVKKMNENKENNNNKNYYEIDITKILLIIITIVLVYFGITYYKDRQEKIKEKEEQQKIINDAVKSLNQLNKYIK